MSEKYTCRLCGDEYLYTGTHYICEQCDEVFEDVGGSYR